MHTLCELLEACRVATDMHSDCPALDLKGQNTSISEKDQSLSGTAGWVEDSVGPGAVPRLARGAPGRCSVSVCSPGPGWLLLDRIRGFCPLGRWPATHHCSPRPRDVPENARQGQELFLLTMAQEPCPAGGGWGLHWRQGEVGMSMGPRMTS